MLRYPWARYQTPPNAQSGWAGQLWRLIAFTCKMHAKQSIKTVIFLFPPLLLWKTHKRHTKTSLLTKRRNLLKSVGFHMKIHPGCYPENLTQVPNRVQPSRVSETRQETLVHQLGFTFHAAVSAHVNRPPPPTRKIAAFQKALINHFYWMVLLKCTFCTFLYFFPPKYLGTFSTK